jgi:GNAT superfamily N-acetyltransferase
MLRKYLDDLRTLPADLAIGWRRERWHGLWEALAVRSVYRVVRWGRFIVYAQPLAAAKALSTPAGVRLARLTDADWIAVEQLVGRRELQRFRSLYDRGHLCTLAWRGGRLIGYAWVALRIESAVTECPVPLPPGAAYLWDLYVVPEERAAGVGSALARARLRLAREHGRVDGWRMIAPDNHASVKTLSRSGSTTRVVGELRYVKLFSRMRSRFVPAGGASA